MLLKLVTHFDEGFPDRGFSTIEMLRSLRRQLEKNKVHLVVVLDEADMLFKKGAGDLIYHLSRFDEERVGGGKASMSVILILSEVPSRPIGQSLSINVQKGQYHHVR